MKQSENLYGFQGVWWESCLHLINQFPKVTGENCGVILNRNTCFLCSRENSVA